jgi:hypothetical protein
VSEDIVIIVIAMADLAVKHNKKEAYTPLFLYYSLRYLMIFCEKFSSENSPARARQSSRISRDLSGVRAFTASIVLYTVKSAGTRSHVFPWIILSLYHHSSTAITGIPHAILSIATEPKFSFFDKAILATADPMIFVSLRSLDSR